MSHDNSYRGWTLVQTNSGWMACHGSERVRVASSRAAQNDDLYLRFRSMVDSR